jgi:amino acid transporter
MNKESKLSFGMALLINLNIMLGVGIFINTVELSRQSGILGALSYLLIGIMMLPLIISIATLLKIHPSGGFYIFARNEISPFAGFMSAWGYFSGKLASCAVMIHSAVLIIQSLITPLAIMHPFILDSIILSIFIILNMLHLKTGSFIQMVFMILKAIPIIFLIFAGLFLMQGSNFVVTPAMWYGIPASLPIVLYVIVGFESACSLSSHIVDSHKNAPWAIFLSYGIVVTVAILFQLIFYGVLGSQLASFADFRSALPTFLQTLLPSSPVLAHKLSGLLHLAIASSALGGAYGILFSNNWNLYILAQHKHVFFSGLFTRFNRYFIPFACILVEGALVITYLIATGGKQVYLQQLAALSATLAYTMSVIALLYAKLKRPEVPIRLWIPIFGLITCLILLGACIRNFAQSGIISLYVFIGLLLFGAFMYRKTSAKLEGH